MLDNWEDKLKLVFDAKNVNNKSDAIKVYSNLNARTAETDPCLGLAVRYLFPLLLFISSTPSLPAANMVLVMSWSFPDN